MGKLPESFFTDDNSEGDEIDELFSQLEIIEPPESLVARIMDAVAFLPLPHIEQDELPGASEELIVRVNPDKHPGA